MATSFSTIYQRALFKLKPYDIFNIDKEETKEEDVYEILHMYLLSAQADFEHLCETDLTKINLENTQYEEDLSNIEIEILALGIRYHYVDYLSANEELFRNSLSTKDYSMYSPANLLKEIMSAKDQYYQEYKRKIIEYTYTFNDIATLKA